MNTTYAFTLSPPNRLIGTKLKNFNRILYDSDRLALNSILMYNRIKRFIIYPEFDEKGRLHYHGNITVNNTQKVRLFKHAMCKMRSIGFVDLKPLESFNDKIKWICYCKKQWHIARSVLEIEKPIMCLDK